MAAVDTRDPKTIIAARIGAELKDGDVVNLGIGLPEMVANNLPEGVELVLQSENGIMGMGPASEPGKENIDIVNAGAKYVTVNPGAMFFDSSTSFGFIRGGHVDATVLGAMQVDANANIANWIIPGKMVPGMGGAMDLVVGAKKVIVGMIHTQKGAPKILKKCSLPLTAVGVVSEIVTEMAVLEYKPEGLTLTEIHPDHTVEEVIAATEAEIIVSPDLKPMLGL
jgi:acetate CoA/acetoacetate CoA-transferase beta subunit